MPVLPRMDMPPSTPRRALVVLSAISSPLGTEIWTAMEEAAQFRTLGSLPEAVSPFPHFDPVDGLTG